VFSVMCELRLKQLLSIERHHYKGLPTFEIDCKSSRLRYFDICCKYVAKIRRNVLVCIKIPIVLRESIHEFNVHGE
jgi:hypothetical protein